jgi:hypothetical protein
MATDDSTNATAAPQMGHAEMHALAARLRARGDSVLMRDQPEQARDLRAAASLIAHLAELHTAIRTAAATNQ